MATCLPCFRSKVTEEDLSAKQYHFVKDGTGANSVVLCDTAGELAAGILMDKPKALGSPAAVSHLNDGKTAKVILAEAVATVGVYLTTDANGQAILADTSTHRKLCRALQTGAIGDIVEVELSLDGSVA